VDALGNIGPVPGPIRSAGGVVARRGHEASVELLLVHRPRFDDWSLPKGKLKRGEHALAAAVREVFEETSVLGAPGIRLPTASYQVWSGPSLVDKHVEYWAMTVTRADLFVPTNEVDRVAWAPIAQALQALSYPHDRRVVGAYAELPVLHRPVVLLRNASADPSGRSASVGNGPDDERSLDEQGVRQAAALATLVPLFGPGRLISAEPLPCRQTMAGIAAALDLGIDIDGRFADGADATIAAQALRGLADPDTATVVCGQGELMSSVLAILAGRAEPEHRVAVGDAVVLCFAGDELIAADPFTTGVS
jgi:8-oxo-dGTP diphosphatase